MTEKTLNNNHNNHKLKNLEHQQQPRIAGFAKYESSLF